MKKILTYAIALSMVVACGDATQKVEEQQKLPAELVKNPKTAESNAAEVGRPIISFEKEEHDFGTVIEGEKLSYSFRFTNTGDAPLIISHAKGSCGCTVPNWSKKPVAPGETGTIDVSFNSAGRSGKQTKAVTLTTNAVPNTKVIRITSEVIDAQ